ncbi:hypothetical protein SAMN02745247_02794 [Butyrivibrio hungatei DSM 14810]|uniref:Uncharacterized protein n=1 Tax=Butyrivibrio hungatei DSM 14810 TaxID=1121132 RepID=A0A1M7T0N9_9FIRM|nr:hypothetical protein [Butyrivibrio hungatei]SHN64345.1 hypothetical protein SAMN02745247_02794 [Butyrivibrio hungatei DSM 14810]
MKEQTGLDQYLMLLSDNDYFVNLTIGDDRIYQDSIFNKVVKNCIVVNNDEMELIDGQIKIQVNSSKNGELIDEAVFYIPDGADVNNQELISGGWIQSLAIKIEE